MAIAFVKEVNHAIPNAPGASTVLSVANAPSAGNLLILSVAESNFGASSVADSKGNTWNKDKTVTSTDVVTVFSTTQNVGTLTVSDTITVTFAGSVGGRAALACHEFSGCTNTIDVSASGTHTVATTARDSGSVTTTNANDLLWCAFEAAGAETSLTAGAGYTAPTTAFYASGTTVSVEFQYRIVSATGTYAGSATGGAKLKSGGVQIAYKAASGAVANTLTASPGAMAITGAAITPPVKHAPTASPGSYAVTGSATTLPVKHSPSLSSGAMSITGKPALLPVARRLSLSPGSLSIAGNAITAKVARILNLIAGIFSITGDAATLTASASQSQSQTALNPTPGPYKTGADMHGFNPFPGTARIPGSACFTGPLSQWVPYHDVMMIAYDYANQLFLGTRDKSCLQALANMGIGGKV